MWTVFVIRMGGSAGLRMMIALPLRRAADARPRPAAVVSVNSSMFCRVPGPALLLAIGGDDLGVLDRRNASGGGDDRHRCLAAAADEVDVRRRRVRAEVHNRDHVRPPRRRRQVDGQHAGSLESRRVPDVGAGARGVEHDAYVAGFAQQAVDAVRDRRYAMRSRDGEAVGCRIDPGNDHGLEHGASQQLQEQIGADVARTQDADGDAAVGAASFISHLQ